MVLAAETGGGSCLSLSLLGCCSQTLTYTDVMCFCRRLTVKHTRTLQLEEDVLCVKFSPDHRLLAISLLDCTVKLFYTDTLKVKILILQLNPAAPFYISI